MAQQYVSDITQFLRDLKTSQPELETDQKKGRAIWWDRHPVPAEQKQFGEARVNQTAYVYQTKV